MEAVDVVTLPKKKIKVGCVNFDSVLVITNLCESVTEKRQRSFQ